MSRRMRNLLIVVAAAPVVLGVGIWYAFIDRAVSVTDRDGWHLRFSRIRLACPVCTGRVEELTWHKEPVLTPAFEEPGTTVIMFCSLGMFTAFREAGEWQMTHGKSFVADRSDAAITQDELQQGYYDYATIPDSGGRHPGTGPFYCKEGTPPDWALAISDRHARWLRPTLVHGMAW